MSNKKKVKKEIIRSAVNMGNLMLTDLKKQGIIPKGAKIAGSEALKHLKEEQKKELKDLLSRKKKGKSEEEAIKEMLKQTKQFKKNLDLVTQKQEKMDKRNMPTVKKKSNGWSDEEPWGNFQRKLLMKKKKKSQ